MHSGRRTLREQSGRHRVVEMLRETSWSSRLDLRGSIMKYALLALCLSSLALAGCRRETPYYEPMKLGGSTAVQTSR